MRSDRQALLTICPSRKFKTKGVSPDGSQVRDKSVLRCQIAASNRVSVCGRLGEQRRQSGYCRCAVNQTTQAEACATGPRRTCAVATRGETCGELPRSSCV